MTEQSSYQSQLTVRVLIFTFLKRIVKLYLLFYISSI